MRNLCAILAAVLIFSCASVGRAQGPQENIQPNSGYPDSEDGFRTQFNAVLKAYCSGDRAQGISLLDGLRLPDSADWFAQNFEPNEAPKLSARYDQLAKEYLASMERTSRISA